MGRLDRHVCKLVLHCEYTFPSDHTLADSLNTKLVSTDTIVNEFLQP